MAYELETQVFSPATGTTVTVQNSPAALINFYINPPGNLAALTINMPNAPHNGQQVSMCSRRAVTALTLNPGVAGGGFNITAPTSIVVNAAITFCYISSVNLWVRYSQTP